MRKLITFILLALAGSSAWSQTNIPNRDFETWYNVVVSPTLNYDDIGTGPADNWLGTLNSLAAIPQIAGGPGPVTVFKSTDKHSGTYAAKAVSANFPLGPVTVFIPGMIGTAIMDNVNVRAILGKPCTDWRPTHLKGYFKFEPVNGDSCSALILLSKWNSTLHMRDTIGYGKMIQRTAVSEYTQFDVPVSFASAQPVDSITVLLISSAGFNLVNFMGSIGQVGSTMYVDDLTLEYPNGIQQVLMPEVSVTVYPNPASEFLHVDLSKEVKNGLLEVFTTDGKLAGKYSISKSSNTMPIYALSTGTYYFRLMSGKELVNTGSFVVKK